MQRLEAGLQKTGISAPVNIMLSNGGTCTVETAATFPIRLVESGPAGGALAGGFGGWTDAGCRLRSDGNGYSQCECDHLTNFAVLVV